MSQQKANPKEDLDAFLIGVESKLRGPFSSLVLADTAMRASSPREYLLSMIEILSKMDKVVKLRLCVGLLGLEPSGETDDVVYDILTRLQEAPLHEEWVRVVAGVCQGIIFANDGSRESCGGEEAQSLIEKTSTHILSRVDEDGELNAGDLDPLFAPYYYSLLDTDTLKGVLPHCLSNPHFQVNREAPILQVDDDLEQDKTQEESKTFPTPQTAQSESTTSSLLANTVVMPGMRSNKPSSSSSQVKAPLLKSSMFIQSKRPNAGSMGGRNPSTLRKTPALARKVGSAQSLLAKGRKLGQLSGAGRSTAASRSSVSGGRERAMKYGNNRSKMKMIDVSEVKGLQERDSRIAQGETKEQKMNVRKRKIMEAAAAKGLVSEATVKKAKTREAEKTPTGQLQGTASTNSVPTADSVSMSGNSSTTGEPTPAVAEQPRSVLPSAAPQATPSDKQDWRLLLEKANKLSADDRFRVKSFFTDRFNPTPSVPVYKMKLHEEKMMDPETKGMVKETLYLELDYNTYGFKKLRKRKKYDT